MNIISRKISSIFFTLLLSIFSSHLYAEITVGASSQQSTDSGSMSFTHDLSSGSNRAVVVGVSIEGNKNIGRTTSITYGGVVMHAIPNSFASIKPGNFAISTELFYLLDAELPALGSQTILISHDGADATSGALLLMGVQQINPEAVATNAATSSSSISANISTLTANALLVDIVGGGHPQDRASLQAGAGQTSFWATSAKSSQGGGSTRLLGNAGSYTQEWSMSGMNREALSVAAFAPADGGTSVNQPPVLNAIGHQSLQEGTSQSITITATDADGDALTLSSSALPSYATFTDNGNSTATLALAPQIGDAGTNSITISVTDGTNAAVSESITITVTEPPSEGDVITLGATSQQATSDATLTFNHSLSNGVNRAVVVGVAIEAKGQDAGRTTTIHYGGVAMHAIPDSFVFIKPGNFSFSTELFYLLDNELPSSGNTSIQITHNGEDVSAGAIQLNGVTQSEPEAVATNGIDSPSTLSTTITTISNNALILDIAGGGHPANRAQLAADASQTSYWSASADSSQGAGSTRQVSAAGNYTQLWNTDSMNRGAHSVVAFAPAAGGTPTNQSPVLNPIGDQSLQEGTSQSITITATDADGDALTLSSSALPSYATFTDNGNDTATLVLAPQMGDAGTSSLTISVTDGTNAPVTETIDIEVTTVPVNQAPVLNPIGNQSLQEGANQSITITATDADGDALTLSSSALPSYATFTDNGNDTATLVLAPQMGDAGTSSLTISVTDGTNAPVTETIDIEVTTVPVNQTPVLNPIGNQSLQEGANQSITITATDADGDALTLSSSTLPSYATFTDNGNDTATLVLAPQMGDAGTNPITISVTDGTNAAVSESITITVTEPPSEGDVITLGATSQQAISGAPLTFSHSLSNGVNRAVVVGVAIEAKGQDAGRTTTIHYGGVAMHAIPDSFVFIKPGNFSFSTELFYLLDNELPSSGNNSIQITHNGEDVSAGAIQLNGVTQSAPEAVATNAIDSPSTLSTTITTISNNALILDIAGGGHPANRAQLAADASQTSYWSASADSSQGAGSTRQVSAAGNYTQLWNTDSMNRGAHSVVAFAPAADGTPTNQSPVLNPIGDQSLQEGTSQSITITATDADGDALTLSSSALPSYATFTDNGNNTATLALAPQMGDAGTSSLTISVTDGTNAPVTETITIEITEFTQSVIINEFLADNATSLVDGDGKNSDWIELYNPTASAIDISGWCLTDEPAEPQQWCFPAATTLAANDYLIVFASKADPAPEGEFHAQLKLSKGGEYLALLTPEGVTVDEFSPVFPPQIEDVSYGRDTSGNLHYFSTLTPDSANGVGFLDLLLFDNDSVSVNASGTTQVTLSTASESNVPYSLASDASWLNASAASGEDGSTSDLIDIIVNTIGLGEGEYTGTITATAADHLATTLTVTLTVGGTTTEGTVVINEIMAGNNSTLATAEGNFEDWIEIKNTGTDNVSLLNWCLMDGDLTPWCFPSIDLPAGGYLVVFASKDDITEGNELHTDFKLGKGGEYLGLIKPDGSIADEFEPEFPAQIDDVSYGINSNGERRYFTTATPNAANTDGVVDLLQFATDSVLLTNTENSIDVALETLGGTSTSYTLSVDDGGAGWLSATPSTGEDGVTADQVTIQANATGLSEGTYAGTVTASANGYQSSVVNVTLTVGAAPERQGVIINEILAGNENTNYDTDHYQFSDWIELYNNTDQSIDISGYYLSDDPALPEQWQVPSNTVIGAGDYLLIWADDTDQKDNELHTNFKLSAGGETITLADESGVVIDTFIYNDSNTDISVSNVGGVEVYMTPTPEDTNSTAHSTLNRSIDPAFSVDEGFYGGAQSVELTQEGGGEIYYTTDGSIPSATSTLYSQAIQVTETMVIRAVAYVAGKLPSKVNTNSYFISEESTLPMISVSMNPDHLFDDTLGIYARGTNGTYGINCDNDDTPSKYANWNQEWNRPVNIEYFDKDNLKTFEFGADIAISGQCSRYHSRKSFAIELDSKYGTKSLKYALYENKPDVNKIKDFKIRAGDGNDILSTLLAHSGNFNVDYQAYQAVRFFLNGEYWGVYNLREKKGKDFLKSNYPDIDEDNTDIIAYNLHGYVEKAGDITAFDEGIKAFIDSSSTDLSTEADYQTVLTMLDEDNFIDYMIVMLHSGNKDWIWNNTRWWRENVDGAKWRFMLDDLDRGYRTSDEDLFRRINQSSHLFISKLYLNLMENTTFKQKFISRFHDRLDTVFQPDNIRALAQIIADERRDYVEGAVWRKTQDSVDRTAAGFGTFAEERLVFIREQLDNL